MFSSLLFAKFEVIVSQIRQVIDVMGCGMTYDSHIDLVGGDYEDGFISPARPCFVPWMGRAVSETRAALADGEHCREMAGRLHELARVARLTGMRRELVYLAKRYDRRGDHFDHPADRQGC